MLHICFYLQDSKSISAFIAYALCAADEALRDANWLPNETEKKERTVT
jgi:3-oxoacyl-[acyl-carrier-protein] synthase II